MNYIKGKFRSSIYKNDNGYYVGLFKVKETNDEEMNDFLNKTITFTGYFSSLNAEDTYIFYGKYIYHERYGFQYQVSSYEKVVPEGKDGIIEFLSSDLIKGCGEKTAIKIVETYGEDSLNIIKSGYENLLLINGITENRAKKIYDSIVNYTNTDELIVELRNIGFSIQDSLNLINKYENVVEIAKNNTYKFIDEISFNKLDEIYLKNNESNSTLRINACILETINRLCFYNGDTYTNIEEIENGLKNYFNLNCIIDENIKELKKSNSIIEFDNKYFLKNYYDMEKDIALNLSKINNQPKLKIKNFKEKINEIENSYKVNYSLNQEEAIKTALENNISIITGGPGTGKTTIINAIVKLYIQINKISPFEVGSRIALIAPTGRASKRMSETTLFGAMTIHRYLKWNKETNSFGVNEENKLHHELIIIDETSMIDTYLFDSLLKGISSNVKLVLVGDAFQLPSVGPGLILNDLINSDKIKHIELTKIYRQSDNSYIPILAKEIKDRKLSDNYKDQKDDYNFIHVDNISIKNIICDICERCIKKGLNEKDMQILIPMYKGENGIDNINLLLKNIFNPIKNKKEIRVGDTFYRENDKVLQLVNDTDNNVYNGDIGFIDEIYDNNRKKYILSVNFDGNYVDYKKEDLNKIKHAYAISIHKSQGSEFNHVIIPIVSNYNKMLYNKIIYTAVSRAKKSLVIMGDEKYFIKAIENDYSVNRKTNLINQIIEYF